MNGQLSFQSSAMCDDASPSTLVSALANQATAINTQRITDMATQKLVNKKRMFLMALCLVFATAVPVVVLAAG